MVDGTGLENQRTKVSQVRILSFPPKKLSPEGLILFGAGRGSRTLVSSLGRIHNSRYTIPALEFIIT